MDQKVKFYFVFFPLAILLFLSFLEARRYRYFYTSAKRVQCLEVGFYVKPIFQHTTDDQFYGFLNNLTDVELWIDLRKAWVIRFYRNYIWLYHISLVMMTYKYMSLETKQWIDLHVMLSLYTACIIMHICGFVADRHYHLFSGHTLQIMRLQMTKKLLKQKLSFLDFYVMLSL